MAPIIYFGPAMVCTAPLLLLYWLYRPTVLTNPGLGSLKEPVAMAMLLPPSQPESRDDAETSSQAPLAEVAEDFAEPAPADKKQKTPPATRDSHRIVGHRNLRFAGSVRRLASASNVSAAAANPGRHPGMSWGAASAYAYAVEQSGQHRWWSWQNDPTYSWLAMAAWPDIWGGIAGAHAVKLEGVRGHADIVRHIVESGVPVMGHLGLTPQSINLLGGMKVQARTEAAVEILAAQARELEEAGCFSLVLECVPSAAARKVTDLLGIPTIGIGAGPNVDGQVLVYQDVLGLNPGFRPKFLRVYANTFGVIQVALNAYDRDVKDGGFPLDGESYDAQPASLQLGHAA